MLSKQSLEIIQSIVSENSGVQIPVALIKNIVEIREWVAEQLKSETP